MGVKNSNIIFLCVLGLIILSTSVLAATYTSVKDIPAVCTGGTITSDTFAGTCRTTTCSSSSGSLQTLACDKPDTATVKEYFEMYKKTSSGTVPKICIDTACIQGNGYAKSNNYPIVQNDPSTNTSNPPQTNTTNPPPSGEQCSSRVQDIPATCTGGTITSDTSTFSCRTITCDGSSGSIKVLACNKPDTGTKQYFEMYKQSSSGTVPKLCIGSTCLQSGGYVKSPNYPICTSGGSTTNTTNPPANNTPPTTLTANVFVRTELSADHNVIPQCDAPFLPTEFKWEFGDGTTYIKNASNGGGVGGTFWNRYHHTYLNTGNYLIKCTAKNSTGAVATGSVGVVVKTEATPDEISATLPGSSEPTSYNPYVFRLVNQNLGGSKFRIGGYSVGIPHNADGSGQSGYWLFSLPFYSYATSTHDNIVTVTFPEPGNYTFFADPGINWDELDPTANRWGVWMRGCSNPRTTCYNSAGGGTVIVPRINARTEFGIQVKKISDRTYNLTCQSYVTDQGGSGYIVANNDWANIMRFTGNQWFTYTFPSNGTYQIQCNQAVSGLADKIYYKTIDVASSGGSDDPGAISTLKLHSGRVFNQDIYPWGTILDVTPGQRINGTVTVQWDSDWPSSISAPLIMTPSWGNHQSSFSTHGNAQGSGTRAINVDFTAPSAPGTYYIIFAYRAEIDGGDVASMTNWARSGGEIWNDGNDVASWNSAMLEGVWSRGRVLGKVLADDGLRDAYVPATMIEVRVH
jgi:plastocyanin